MTGPFPNPLPSPLDPSSQADTSATAAGLVVADNILVDCRQVLVDVDATILRAINDCLNICQADVRFCQACIVGAIQKEQSIAATVLDQCWQKINRQLVSHVGEAFQAAQSLGIPLPTAEQLAQALAGQEILTPDPILTTTAGITPAPVVVGNFTGSGTTFADASSGGGSGEGDISAPPSGGADQPDISCPDGYHPGNYRKNPLTGNIDYDCLPDKPPPPPPPPPPDPCHPGGPAERVVCTRTFSTVSLKPLWWYTANFIQGDEWEICLYKGFNPPTEYTGKLQGPFCAEPDPSLVIAAECEQQCKDIPPPPPPPPPPDGGPPKGDGQPPKLPPRPPEKQPLPPGAEQSICNPNAVDWVPEFIRTISESMLGEDGTGDLTQNLGQLIPGNVGITTLGSDPGKWVINAIGNLGARLISLVGGLTNALADPFLGPNCNTPARNLADGLGSFTHFLGGWFGIVPERTQTVMTYASNLTCQYRLPVTTEAVRSYSRGYFTQSQFEFITKANGDCLDWQRLLLETAYTRIGIQDAYRLWQLDDIDEEEFEQAWKRQGINTDKDRKKFEAALRQYPGMADLVRMMLRDVEDREVVELLDLDNGFTDKWDGTLKQWGTAQGVSNDVAKYFWRAHWQSPSPQQVFTWLQRLRPDDRDPDDPNKNVIVDKDKARELLKIADYVPGLLDAYIATSYRPFTRRDISRLYRLGAIRDSDGLRRAFRDVGLSDLDARRMATATIRAEAPAKAKLRGEMGEAGILGKYRNDTITEAEARELLTRLGF
jgi:hypothetical protein